MLSYCNVSSTIAYLTKSFLPKKAFSKSINNASVCTFNFWVSILQACCLIVKWEKKTKSDIQHNFGKLIWFKGCNYENSLMGSVYSQRAQSMQYHHLNSSSSFEPDVVLCSVSVIPLQHRRLFCLHVFRQAGPPQQVDCLGPRWEIALSIFPKKTTTHFRIGSRTNGSQHHLNWYRNIITSVWKELFWNVFFSRFLLFVFI